MSTSNWMMLMAFVLLLFQQIGTPPCPEPQPPIEVVVPCPPCPDCPDVPVVPPVIPPVDPPVVPPVIEQGRRTVVIIHETENQSPEFTQMLLDLRTDHYPYFQEKDHDLLVLDSQEVNESGEPLDLIEELKGVNSTWPALFILESSDGRPLHDETLTDSTTDEYVMQVLKANGG